MKEKTKEELYLEIKELVRENQCIMGIPTKFTIIDKETNPSRKRELSMLVLRCSCDSDRMELVGFEKSWTLPRHWDICEVCDRDKLEELLDNLKNKPQKMKRGYAIIKYLNGHLECDLSWDKDEAQARFDEYNGSEHPRDWLYCLQEFSVPAKAKAVYGVGKIKLSYDESSLTLDDYTTDIDDNEDTFDSELSDLVYDYRELVDASEPSLFYVNPPDEENYSQCAGYKRVCIGEDEAEAVIVFKAMLKLE